jgi:steroid 5-alpha reductase family enzyme
MFLELYGLAALTVLAVVIALWLLSLPLRDASIIDMAWGPLFVAIVWVLLPATGAALTAKVYFVSLFTTLWGMRLAVHLLRRNLGSGEDRRYQLWREHGGPWWWLKSLYRVYLLQGVLALLVATPIIAAFWAPDHFSAVNLIGAGIWVVGFCYELVADIQLERYLARCDEDKPDVMSEGLWAWSRHPNYFGDALQWWGLGLVAFSAAAWWALIGPVVMTAIFLGLSNDILEKGLSKRRKGYAEYVTNTPKFFPWPSRRATDSP